jgi:hypothetical protein
MNPRLGAAVCYILLPLLIAGAWFVWRTSFVPQLVFEYIRPIFPGDSQARAILGLLAISGLSGLLVGASFGIALGFLLGTEQTARVIGIGCGAIAAIALWSIFAFSQENAPALSMGYFISSAFEVITFMVSLVLVSYATHRFGASLSANSRTVLGFAVLACSLLVYYEMFRMLRLV